MQARQKQIARLTREETLASLQVELSNKKRVRLAQLRKFVRPVRSIFLSVWEFCTLSFPTVFLLFTSKSILHLTSVDNCTRYCMLSMNLRRIISVQTILFFTKKNRQGRPMHCLDHWTKSTNALMCCAAHNLQP